MPRAELVLELDIRVFNRPRAFAFRGRSLRALAAALRREAERSSPHLGRLAGVVEALAGEGWRYGTFKGQTVTLVHPEPQERDGVEAFLAERFGGEVLEWVTLRERSPGEGSGPPPLPKADDEFSRQLRRLIGAEAHKKDLYLGHPTEELSELLLDMSFLAQEAIDYPDVARLLDQIRAAHAEDTQYQDLHNRYLSLTERTGMGHPAAEEAYWDLFSYTARKLSRLIPALRSFLEKRGFGDLCEHEATAFLSAALSLALSAIESDDM